MKKKLVALVLVGMMSVSLLAGCGGGNSSSSAPAAAPAQTKDEAPAAEAPASTQSSGSITFSDLQDNYVILTDVYQKVEDLYMNDAIAQDDEVEGLLTEAKDLIDQMGELNESDFSSEDDMIQLNDAMVNVIEGLGKVVDMMSAADDGTAAADDGAEEAASDVSYVDGFYANDGNGNDFMIFFYETSNGDVAYVNDGTDEAFAEYTVENAQLDDGTEFLLVTVGATQMGYVEDGSDIYLVDADGNTYAASRLTESEAEELHSIVTK
ncbi:MAG: hypothetical protein IJU50_03590 [Lachnospiraceae bacterium]|nr:hypothetical protein [Lachnospiraceae bacterium]